jgi:hypothetical protein
MGRNDIAAKLSVKAADFYVYRFERIWILQTLTDGRVTREVIILPHRPCARPGMMLG